MLSLSDTVTDLDHATLIWPLRIDGSWLVATNRGPSPAPQGSPVPGYLLYYFSFPKASLIHHSFRLITLAPVAPKLLQDGLGPPLTGGLALRVLVNGNGGSERWEKTGMRNEMVDGFGGVWYDTLPLWCQTEITAATYESPERSNLRLKTVQSFRPLCGAISAKSQSGWPKTIRRRRLLQLETSNRASLLAEGSECGETHCLNPSWGLGGVLHITGGPKESNRKDP